MSAAKLRMTAVCACGWLSDEPHRACKDCGDAICGKCGAHCVCVAAWPGESDRAIYDRASRNVQSAEASMRMAILDEHEDGSEGHVQ